MQPTPFDLTGRAALVTGTSGWLGQRFCRTRHAVGAALVATGRDPDHRRLVALERELGDGRCRRHALDVSDGASIGALFDALAADGIVVDGGHPCATL